MVKPLQGRHTATIEGDFVVFLIGTRLDVRHPIRWFQDLGGRRGMKHMLTHLSKHPEKGLLAFEMSFPVIVQYWRSYEHLEAFAHDESDPHLQAMRNYWRRVGKDNRGGIWHETYLVRADRAGQGGHAGATRRLEHCPQPDPCRPALTRTTAVRLAPWPFIAARAAISGHRITHGDVNYRASGFEPNRRQASAACQNNCSLMVVAWVQPRSSHSGPASESPAYNTCANRTSR
jgi:hypothetical protein